MITKSPAYRAIYSSGGGASCMAYQYLDHHAYEAALGRLFSAGNGR